MLYALVAVLSASWMWLRASGMIVASNWAAIIDIFLVTWAIVYRGGEHQAPGQGIKILHDREKSRKKPSSLQS